jgi:hypothetical protein
MSSGHGKWADCRIWYSFTGSVAAAWFPEQACVLFGLEAREFEVGILPEP